MRVIKDDFRVAAKEFAGNVGCDLDCLENCRADPVNCIQRCDCGSTIVQVGPVNTAAIAESIYGDVRMLDDEQLSEITWSLKQKADVEAKNL